jgi:hypothetical protein
MEWAGVPTPTLDAHVRLHWRRYRPYMRKPYLELSLDAWTLEQCSPMSFCVDHPQRATEQTLEHSAIPAQKA